MILPNSIEIQCFVNMLFWPQKKISPQLPTDVSRWVFWGEIGNPWNDTALKKGFNMVLIILFLKSWCSSVGTVPDVFFAKRCNNRVCWASTKVKPWGDGLRFTHGIPWQLISWTSRLNNLALCYDKGQPSDISYVRTCKIHMSGRAKLIRKIYRGPWTPKKGSFY